MIVPVGLIIALVIGLGSVVFALTNPRLSVIMGRVLVTIGLAAIVVGSALAAYGVAFR